MHDDSCVIHKIEEYQLIRFMTNEPVPDFGIQQAEEQSKFNFSLTYLFVF